MRRHAKALFAVVVAMLVLGATAAFAIDTNAPGTPFDGSPENPNAQNGSNTPNGSYCCLNGVAVDQNGGDVYVVDPAAPPNFAAAAVHRFDNAGAWEATIDGERTTPQLNNPQDVAIDASGNSYVANTANNTIDAFDSTGTPLTGFDTDGVLDGSGIPAAQNPDAAFSSPCGLAIDQATGNLFVADQGHNRIWIFDSSGRYLDRVADSSLQGPCGIALTSTGDLYVRNANDGRVLRFNKTGATAYDFNSVLYDGSEGGATDVATNPADDHVYVNRGDRIVEYDSSSSQISSFGQGVLCCSSGVAVDSSSGTVYATDGGALRTFGPLITTTPPIPTIDPVDPGGITAYSAHLTGTVDPQGFDTTYRFEYSEDHNNWTPLADQGPLSGSGAQIVQDDATGDGFTGLQPNKAYFARLIASNNLDDPVISAEEPFRTDAIPPAVQTVGANSLSSVLVQLKGTVRPYNSPTAYWFEWGTEDCSANPCTAVPPSRDADAGSGSISQLVTQQVSGLQPGTTYHFRLVARNDAGTTEGDDLTFRTPPDTGSLRHFEKVSPAQKGNGDIVGDGRTNVASRAGDAVTLSTRTPFGDTIGSGVVGQTQYVARRTPSGWTTRSITPQSRPEEYQVLFGTTRYQAFAQDLSAAVLFGYDLPAATGDVPLRNNVYVQDLTTRALQTVSMAQNGFPNPLPFFLDLGSNANWGVSADARHVAFVSRVPYLPAAATDGTDFGPPNIYQWDEGVLSLAGILPDGTVPAGGSDAPLMTQPTPRYSATMSADGSRLLFVASTGADPQLYQRIDGTRTVWISEPEFDVTDPGAPPGSQRDPSGVTLRGATPDGRNVFFTSTSPLVRDDSNETTDLYRWTASDDPANDNNLTRITENGFSGLFIGMSDDGGRVYYLTSGNELIAWDHGLVHFVHRAVFGASAQDSVAIDAAPGFGRVTPDGRYLAFVSSASRVFDGVGLTGEVTNGHYEMYLYRLGDRLRCISCPPVEATSDVAITPSATRGVVTYSFPGVRPRFLSDDGEVFFTTAEALVEQDTNGVADTYEYDPMTDSLSLVSTGKGSGPATFSDASASGDDVFFVTRQRLVGSDQDDLVDLYDARIGDALPDDTPEAPTPPCQGETCQPPPATSPSRATIASRTVVGNGNVVSHRVRRRGRCSKRANRAGKHRRNCAKKKGGSKKRAANSTRRTGR